MMCTMALYRERLGQSLETLILPSLIAQCYKIMQAVHTDAEDFLFLVNRKIFVLPCGLPYHNSEGHCHWGQATPASYPGMRRKYTLPTAICPTIHNRERPFVIGFCSSESCVCVFYHNPAAPSTCRSAEVWINLRYVSTQQ